MDRTPNSAQHGARASFLTAWILLAAPASGLFAASSGEWRYWQAQQGLADSYIHAISRDAKGGIWAVHGDLQAISHFDGRSFTVVKVGPASQALDSLDGKDGWIVDTRRLRYLHEGRLEPFPGVDVDVPNDRRQNRVLDLGDRRALVLLPDKILRVSAKSHRVETIAAPPRQSGLGAFVTFGRALDGKVFVVGEQGVAFLSFGPAGSPPYQWKEYLLGRLPVGHLQDVIPGLNGEVFVSGIHKATNNRVALVLSQGKWNIIADRPETGRPLLAWRDSIGNTWLADGDVLQQKLAANYDAEWKQVDPSNEVLSGLIYQVLMNQDGSFFIATTRGIALHVNPAWKGFGRTRDSHGKVIELRQHMSSAIKDRKGGLWFLGHKSLFQFRAGVWDEFPLPKTLYFDSNHAHQLGELPDGRILLQPQRPGHPVIFDPEKLTYSDVALPGQYQSMMLWRRVDGRFVLPLVSPGEGSDAVAIFDGERVSEPVLIHAKWDLTNPRAIFETSKGELWVGGTSGVGRWMNGKYERIHMPAGSQSTDPTSELRSRAAFSFVEQEDGQLLIGGRDGLYRWTGSKVEYAVPGIESARRLMRDQSGTLWAASGSGVFRAAGKQLTGGEWTKNDVSDGLPVTVSQTILEDSQGRIWVTTTKGPAMHRPEADQDPPVVAIRADQNSSKAGPDGEFRIIFSGKDKWDLTPDGRLLFSYRLDGGAWSPISRSKMATFENLPAGKHVFEATALDNQGNASSLPAKLEFSVFAPWYRTTGFLIFMTAAMLTIGHLGWLVFRHYRERGKLIVLLSNARVAAEAASLSKSEFLANMSHEIRTPMSGVIGMTDLALQCEVSEDVREYLQTVKISGQSLLRVINDILDFSKIEAGKMELDPIPFRLRDSLEGALRTIAIRAQEKGLELACEIDDAAPDGLIGDPGRLRQIILNLIGNAIKFTERGEVVLSVRVKSREGSRVELAFFVRDTGIGIPRDTQKFVFDSFSQSDGSTSRKYGGTGLGLTISKRLVGMMKGEIGLESELGKGTTIHFTCCFEVHPELQSDAEAPEADLRGLSVLVVDDNATNRRMLDAVLRAWNLVPTQAENGPTAIGLLEQRSFDLLLLDMQMPGMDGFEVAEMIRNRWPESAMRIIMLSSIGQRGDVARTRTLLVDGYLAKPVKHSELFVAIQRLFARRPESSPEPTARHSGNDERASDPLPSQRLDILLAEDNVVNQKIVQRYLEMAGHTVSIAVNGLQAIEKFEAKAFDLILMDIQMPEMDGFDATRAIRARESAAASNPSGHGGCAKRIPIIALTAHAMAGDRDRCLQAGMDGYITKPIQTTSLFEEIARLAPAVLEEARLRP